jgi:hypothetical protein
LVTSDSSLIATRVLDTDILARLAIRSITSNPPAVRELLLVSKNEQTFSGLLAQELSKYPTLQLDEKENPSAGITLLELKGKDYITYDSNNRKKSSRNFHDLSIINQMAETEVIIENKVWYHFDGAKGARVGKPEPRIAKQIEADILKIKQTLDGQPGLRRGFILLNVVTPADPDLIPKSYRTEHQKVWDRCMHNPALYREEGGRGIREVLEGFSRYFTSIHGESYSSSDSMGFIDVIAAEVAIE